MLVLTLTLASAFVSGAWAEAAPARHSSALSPAPERLPNILVIFSDDVGYWNVSAYSRGMMGYRTPSIDRIAKEGALFTDYYGEQTSTAARAAFLTGQYAVRAGLSKAGLPGGYPGLSDRDVTLARLLKSAGYLTGLFGQYHLGDRNEFLPTVHGFDEFLGNFYALRTHLEAEDPDYPKRLTDHSDEISPRGVIHSFAAAQDDPTIDKWFGRVGRQTITDTGPLTTERLPTIDAEYLAGTMRFIRNAHSANRPFFTWFAPTRMHFPTTLQHASKGATGHDLYADGMVEHDGHVGQLLDLLDELAIAHNTIVLWTSDNGAVASNWPDGGSQPFRSEPGDNGEGSFRVPCVIRWPGVVTPGTELNGLASHHDWLPTFTASATGKAHLADLLRQGTIIEGTSYRVHLDGHDLRPYLNGAVEASPRRDFLYFADDRSILAWRFQDWKFGMRFSHGERDDLRWTRAPSTSLRIPSILNVRRDPFERAPQESLAYRRWVQEKQFMIAPAIASAAERIASFKEFPPRDAPVNHSLDMVLKLLRAYNANMEQSRF